MEAVRAFSGLVQVPEFSQAANGNAEIEIQIEIAIEIDPDSDPDSDGKSCTLT